MDETLSETTAPPPWLAGRFGGLEPSLARMRSLERSLRSRAGWVAIGLYVLGALVMQRHAVAHITYEISGNGPGDPTQFMWVMWWFPHAILHGLNPFVTHAIWVNDTYNLGSVTSTPLPAVLMAPVTLLLGAANGPVVSYNVANLAAPIISAWFTYRVCLRLTRGAPWASLLGGWLYGFSSYGLSQLQGHLNLVFTFLPPVLALLAFGYLRGEWGARRVALLGALALLCQMFTSTEILFTTTIFGVIGYVLAFVFAPAAMRRRFVPLSGALVVAYAIAGVISLPYIHYALSGPKVGVGMIYEPADLLSYVFPTPDTWVGGKSFAQLSARYPLNTSEQGTYLGIPLIVMMLAAWYSLWASRRVVRALTAWTLVAVLASLGAALTIGGQPTILLPVNWFVHTRLLDQMTPERFGMYAAFGASLAAAMWTAAPTAHRWSRWLLALLAVFVLLPNPNAVRTTGQPIYQDQYVSPTFFTHGLYKTHLYPNEVVLPIPFGYLGDSLLWQAQAKGYFREASGWFGYWPPDYINDPVVQQLIGAQALNNQTVSGMRSFLLGHQVGAIVVQDGQGGPWPAVFAQLGLKPVAVGGVDLYKIPVNSSGAAVLH